MIPARSLTLNQKEIMFGHKQRKFVITGTYTKTHIFISQRKYDKFRETKNTHGTAPKFLVRNAADHQNPTQTRSYRYPRDNDIVMWLTCTIDKSVDCNPCRMKQMKTINKKKWKRVVQSRAICVTILHFLFFFFLVRVVVVPRGRAKKKRNGRR